MSREARHLIRRTLLYQLARTKFLIIILGMNIDDKISSVKFYVDEEYAHLKIKNEGTCLRCETKPCLFFCPANVYRLSEEGKIIVAYQACLECGSCRVACPFLNISWDYPRGGMGLAYKFG
jgi:ferredoxin like protein